MPAWSDLFSFVAVVPAVLVAIFAAVTLNLGIAAWFAPPVKSAITNSVNVAHLYVHEHGLSILTMRGAIASSINGDPELFGPGHVLNEGLLEAKLEDLTRDHGLQGTFVLDLHGRILGSTRQRSCPTCRCPSSGELAEAARGTIEIDLPQRRPRSRADPAPGAERPYL